MYNLITISTIIFLIAVYNQPILNEDKRLPKQCPLPSSFTPSLSKSIEEKKISGNVKLCLIRESCEFYYSICPNPTPVEYQVMAKTLCDQYPELKNKLPINGAYWVSELSSFMKCLF